MSTSRGIGPKAWLACSLALWLLAFGGVRASVSVALWGRRPLGRAHRRPVSSQVPAATCKPTPRPAPGQAVALVGEDTCLTCHDDKRKGYEGTPHAVKSDPRTPAAKQSCETCHGPGGKHVEDPAANTLKNLKQAGKPTVINATCTTCHSRQKHVLWAGSQHETRGLACSTCHSVHSPKSEDKQLKEVTQRELCATCHRDKISKLDRSGHMPVRERKMECTSCHNVHGTTNVRLLRKGDSISELCTSCHADKRGPFLWEHAPSRDGCVTCHDPHGSSNERMLVAEAAAAVPALSRRHAASEHDLRPAGDWIGAPRRASASTRGRVSPVTPRSTGRITRAASGSSVRRAS